MLFQVLRGASARSIKGAVLAGLAALCLHGPALGKDNEDDGEASARPAPSIPNLYLDLRTYYAAVPSGAISAGFGNSGLSSTLQALRALGDLNRIPGGPGGRTSPASQSINMDFPLTFDVTDQVSFYGGVSGGATRTDLTDLSSFAVNSWHLGFQADLHQQNGGSIPTITLQTTATRAVPDGPLATTSFNNIVELDYAFDEDETKGVLAGAQYTRVDIESSMARINSTMLGYAGGYYQWENNWKVTGRFGMQWFGGAQLLNLTPFPSFTQPIVRLDLDRMDDNDNRLFGITAQVAWVPKPAYTLTVRTPLYAVRN